MVDVLRADPGSLGLVTGVGMHMTKHARRCTRPTPGPGRHRACVPMPPRGDLPIVDHHDGPGDGRRLLRAHGRDGGPSGASWSSTSPGGRAYARVEDADDLAALEAEEWVGRTVTLATDGDLNRGSL